MNSENHFTLQSGFGKESPMTRSQLREFAAEALTERNAIVIDRFFDAKKDALAWAEANSHFMLVEIRTAYTESTH